MDRRPDGRRGLCHARPALDSARAARGAARIPVGRGRHVAQADRARRPAGRPAHAHHRDRRQGLARRDDRRGAGLGSAIHRHYRSLQARDDGQRTGRRAAAGAVAADRRGESQARRLLRAQGDRGRHPGERWARSRRRRAGRGRLGRGQRALRPEPVARRDHAADARRDFESLRVARSPIRRAGCSIAASRTTSTWTPSSSGPASTTR